MAPTHSRRSSGLLVFRSHHDGVHVLIAHPGGPLWARKDDGAWSLPKGLVEAGEDDLHAARREFAEEVGVAAPDGEPIDLGQVRLASGKVVAAFAVRASAGFTADIDLSALAGNTFEMVWPPRSGRVQQFREIDRAQWVTPSVARRKLNPAQAAFIDRLLTALD